MDNIDIEIEKVKNEIQQLEEKIKKNSDEAYSKKLQINNCLYRISNLENLIYSLESDIKYAKKISIYFVSHLIASLTCSCFFVPLLMSKYLVNFILSLICILPIGCCAILQTNKCINFKNQKKNYNIKNITRKIEDSKEEKISIEKWLNDNEQNNICRINKLKEENLLIEKNKKIKQNRLFELENLKSNTVKEYVKDNSQLDRSFQKIIKKKK